MFILFAALLVDWFIGDPQRLWKVCPHPVVCFGYLIEKFDKKFNHGAAHRRKIVGVLGVVALLLLAIISGLFLERFFSNFGLLGTGLEIAVVSIFLAQKSLKDHVLNVIYAHQYGGVSGVENARMVLSKIVGRDTKKLNTSQISLASIESLAENYSDGVIAPALFYMVFGLPGILAYKAINTADSMVGHKNERYLYFGWAAAKCDDVLNFIPARFTALLFSLTDFKQNPLKNARSVLHHCRLEAPHHLSPNAGWPECAMAHLLGVKLGGAREYQGALIDLAAFNVLGRKTLTMEDVLAAITLFKRASALFMGGVLILSLFF